MEARGADSLWGVGIRRELFRASIEGHHCPRCSSVRVLSGPSPPAFPHTPPPLLPVFVLSISFLSAMAGYGGLDDLELILDRNLHRALAASRTNAPAPPWTNSGAAATGAEVEDDEEEAVASKEEVAASFGNPLPSAASLSLALNSVLTSSLILSKNNVVPQASQRGGVGPAISGAVPSQKKSHSPVPVMASSKVQVALDIPVATPITVSKKSANYVSAFPEYEKLRGPDFKDPANGCGLRRASIVWFRNDLRVHDNEALVSANRDSLSILPVYCFDPKDYGKSSSGFDKTGPYRANFLLECVANLRSSLRERGSDLIVRVGSPEAVLVDLAKSVGAEALYVHQEVTYEELQAEEKVAAALQEKGIETKYFWGSTLFHLEDLPFKLQDMPSNYGGFREKVQNVAIRDTIEAPQQLKGLPACGNVKPGSIPSIEVLGLNPATNLRKQGSVTVGGDGLLGGEEEALQRLQKFALEARSQTSNLKASKSQSESSGDSLYGANFSCKISPWLTMGCLSPRRMFEDLKKSASSASAGAMSALAVKASGAGSDDNGLNWLVFELLWRDFFRFITKKYGTGKRLSEATPATASTASLVAA
nr:blue-light photoreceptor PHR2-like isoform X3 [Physcomitrium patens]|eukprot:XP_024385637.1 blue-light photoreceptor PHR2-like isoform X3 [Physcomitrella patens]